MPAIKSLIEYEKLKNNIKQAVFLREKGNSYREIGEIMDTSSNTVYNWIVRGEYFLNKYKPIPDKVDPEWEKAYQLLKRFAEKHQDERDMIILIKTWARELKSRSFKVYVLNRFQNEGIKL